MNCGDLSSRHVSRICGFDPASMARNVAGTLGLLLLGALFAPSVGAADPAVVTIMEIQGDGQFSPLVGQTVTTTGVVTLITSDGSDMWIQDVEGDGDPATSDGILVDDRNALSPQPEVGDLVMITGEVEEQQFFPALPRTRIDDTILNAILSTGNALPPPVELEDLPDESIPEGIDFWEPLEGMLVSVHNAPVVAATSRFGEFAMLTKQDAKPGSGFFPQTEQILIRGLGEGDVDYNPERVLVDDASLAPPIIVMPGDRVRSLVGVVDYTFGAYKLQPASFDVKVHDLPHVPASTRSGPKGNAVITTFNVENLFDLEHEAGVVFDVIGQQGVDPGSQWGSDLTSTRDNTLRRKPSICQGDANGADPFDPSLEWDGFPNNTFDGLGTHTVTCGTATGLFISEYVEGSSNNKAIEIYNGTGSSVDLGAGRFGIEIDFNGSPTPGNVVALSGTIADGDVFVVANPSAAAAILAEADLTSSGLNFNGDDAVVLCQGCKDDIGSGGASNQDELDTQLTKLALAIQVELELPDILVVQEVENTAILQELGDRVNGAAGTNYVADSIETSDGRGIEVGFLWDSNRVTLQDSFQLDDGIVPGVSAAFGAESPSPGREPLVGIFKIQGEVVTIVGNHFKSKSGDDPLFGVNQPPIRITEVQRKAQAQVVRDYVDLIFGSNTEAPVMVIGDLNDFQFGEPGEGEDHPVAILEGDGVPLTNLINLEKPAETFTFVFDGNSQVLDHILVSPALLESFVAVDILHFNAGFPDELNSDTTTPLRATDHDAVESRFRFK